jgi:L-fuculose-phosphate aldolase
MLENQRERVAAAARGLAAEGLVLGTAGNASERHGEQIAITPRAPCWPRWTPPTSP